MNKLLEDAQGVIFDVDGLMIDSEPLWRETRDVFFIQKHLVRNSADDHLFVGRGIPEIIQMWKIMYGLQGNTNELTKEYRMLFYTLAVKSNKLKLMEGVTELVFALFDAGKALAIATGGHTRDRMQEILKLFDLEKYFPVIVTSDQIKHGKPAPDIFLFTAREMNLNKSNCVILEDAVNGVQAAKNAGMIVIGVQSEKSTALKLREEDADLVVTSLQELL